MINFFNPHRSATISVPNVGEFAIRVFGTIDKAWDVILLNTTGVKYFCDHIYPNKFARNRHNLRKRSFIELDTNVWEIIQDKLDELRSLIDKKKLRSTYTTRRGGCSY